MINNRIIVLFLFLQGALSLYAQSGNDDRFSTWSDEQYERYEDSIRAVLYPLVVVCKADTTVMGGEILKKSLKRADLQSSGNPFVPTSVEIDTSKEVGQIVIHSGTSQTGARTYDIPIDVPSGMNGHQPNISLSYNSQRGNSFMGVGWEISGLSRIVRCEKSLYYDSKSQGIMMDNSDGFTLDGVRLIKTGTFDNHFLYESEQGNIKAKGYWSGNVLNYFEVFYPNGSKGVYGFTSNTQNKLYYPLTSFIDLMGNVITYSYVFAGNHYTVSRISYNGSTITFNYTKPRQDPITTYVGGLKVYENTLLKDVTIKLGSAVLGTFKLNYTVQNSTSLLTEIDYVSSGKSFNPIRFFYGTGSQGNSYEKASTQLLEWHNCANPNMIKAAKGKFDYANHRDGIISLPNYNPYWKHYRHSTLFRHSQNRFDNTYKGDEKIFLYTGLENNFVLPMPSLLTGAGFIDVLCADLEGEQQEDVIKINNVVANNKDQVTFAVYCSNTYTGMARKYTRSYSFPTVYRDADDGKSIQPKFYYTGDFNGDGRMEILAVSVHQPFGDKTKPSLCYVFDLENNKILHQSHVFPFNMEFVGTQQSNAQVAANNSDKVFVIDYDGDGKTDICHINEQGVNIYTFDINGKTMAARKVGTFTGLKRAGLNNRCLLLGEFNGDGLMDLLVSPPNTSGGGIAWKVYYSKGNGTFDIVSVNGTSNSSNENFIIQDVNGDGISDVIKYDTNRFYTYITTGNIFGRGLFATSYPKPKSILVPTDLNSNNVFAPLVCLNGGTATRYLFNRDDRKESMATGMANSLGVIEKNYYQLLTDDAEFSGIIGERQVYERGYGAKFPYVNVQEPFAVLATSETYSEGSRIDYENYFYKNAVLHRQGLGFCGFGQVKKIKNGRQQFIRDFDPCNYAVLTSEKTPKTENTYTYSTKVTSNKIAKIRLTKKIENNILNNITTTASYKYDSYGYPTEELMTFSDNTTIKRTTAYNSYTDIAADYRLGVVKSHYVATTYNGTSSSEKYTISQWSGKLPALKTNYRAGRQIEQTTFAYDKFGNVISATSKSYSSPNLQTTKYAYDSKGRIIQETNPLGLTTKYAYNALGRIVSVTNPRGGVTKYTYDIYGRETMVINPDNTKQITTYAWSSENNGKYSVTTSGTNTPSSTSIYDAFNREVRTSVTRFNGDKITTDKAYNHYGYIEKVSEPYFGNTPSAWNTYTYDVFDRLLAYTEASGRKTVYSYRNSAVTVTKEGVSTTSTYDVLGRVISAEDPAGIISYDLHADGQPMKITTPGNITTTFGYDVYRRRVSIADPSHGTVTYRYDVHGNVASETNANGKVTKNEYDFFNRLTKRTTRELTTSYTYNSYGELASMSSNNGATTTYTYDRLGRLTSQRENIVDGKWLQKNYSYTDGNVSSIKFTSQNGVLATENFIYSNAYLTEIKLNGNGSIYKLSKENAYGQPTEIITGNVLRKCDFNSHGVLTRQRATIGTSVIQDFSYNFDPLTGNLLSRKDEKRRLLENFSYDHLNRLSNSFNGSVGYDNTTGNILSRSDVGTYQYGLNSKPYAVTGITPTESQSATLFESQDATFATFARPLSIMNGDYKAEFTYNGSFDRVKMNVTQGEKNVQTRYYIGGCYELKQTPSGTIELLYPGGDYYSAPQVYYKNDKATFVFNILRDHLGSITHVTIPRLNDRVVQELSYDAWGRLRNPNNWQVYDAGKEPNLFLGRGYTGHEMLSQFGLINMNARLYDPMLGRFLSADPYVQMPDNSQNFNRYSYCLNNPLKYIDLTGEAFYYTNERDEIDRFIRALSEGETIMSYDFRGGGWGYASDENFISRASYNTSTGMFHFSYGTMENGECVIVGVSFPANLSSASSSWGSGGYSNNSSAWNGVASGGSAAMGVAGFGFSSYAAQRYHNSGGFETWRTSSGKYYNSNILKPQANGKYVQGVQGIRISRDVAKNAVKVPTALGKTLGMGSVALNLYNWDSNSPIQSSVDVARSVGSYFSLPYAAVDLYLTISYNYIRQTQMFNLENGLPLNYGLYLKPDMP